MNWKVMPSVVQSINVLENVGKPLCKTDCSHDSERFRRGTRSKEVGGTHDVILAFVQKTQMSHILSLCL